MLGKVVTSVSAVVSGGKWFPEVLKLDAINLDRDENQDRETDYARPSMTGSMCLWCLDHGTI